MGTARQCSRPVLTVLLVVSIAFFYGNALAQSSLENILKQYPGDAMKGYLQPAADLFSANMNGGYYHSAEIPKAGFHLRFDIIAMGSSVGDDQKTYNSPTPAGFTPAVYSTPTIFGGKAVAVQNTVIPGVQYKGPDGFFNTSLFPLAAPQLTIGSIFGTEAIIRFVPVPTISGGKVPSATLWGIGGRHSISQYIPSCPLAIAAGVFYSSFTAGDLIDYKGLAFGAQASKDFSLLTIYGGFAVESGTTDVKYTYAGTGVASGTGVDISMDAANKFRFTVGLTLNLGIFKIFADANFGKIMNFTGGLGLGG